MQSTVACYLSHITPHHTTSHHTTPHHTTPHHITPTPLYSTSLEHVHATPIHATPPPCHSTPTPLEPHSTPPTPSPLPHIYTHTHTARLECTKWAFHAGDCYTLVAFHAVNWKPEVAELAMHTNVFFFVDTYLNVSLDATLCGSEFNQC